MKFSGHWGLAPDPHADDSPCPSCQCTKECLTHYLSGDMIPANSFLYYSWLHLSSEGVSHPGFSHEEPRGTEPPELSRNLLIRVAQPGPVRFALRRSF